jgi:integrase
MLHDAVNRYLEVRRASGLQLNEPESFLHSFADFASQRGEMRIVSQTAIEWASLVCSLGQRDRRIKVVAQFARYLRAEQNGHEVPPTDVFAYRRTRPTPHIYSQTDINRLIQAAGDLGPAGSLRPHTYSSLFALISVTGLRISEALALHLDDHTSEGLMIHESKFGKSRIVPLHKTAVDGIERYITRRKLVAAGDNHLFVSLQGKGLSYSTVHGVFRELLKTINLDSDSARRRPRIHDLRHTFAVRALEACPKGRDNVDRHMLALSTYLGHSRISDTYWYLEATPDLMRHIADACESTLNDGRS